MFAVKGWNVDASLLKAQTTPFKPQNDSSTTKSESRKRKRSSNDADGTVDDGPSGRKADKSTTPNDVGGTASKKPHKKHQSKQAAALGMDQLEDSRSSYDTNSKPSKKEKRRPEKQELLQPHAVERNSLPERSNKQESRTVSAKPSKATLEQHTAIIKTTAAPTKLTPMQAAMRQKLVSARFRHLNETLYTAPSQQALQLFDANPDMFEDYHTGFRQQVAVWPENPVDKMLQRIRDRGAVRLSNQKKAFQAKSAAQAVVQAGDALPRAKGVCTIADCGCGDARLAQTLKSSNDTQRLNVKVLSYDLYSASPLVVKADSAALPLADGSVDVVIFCLALMGTNWLSFIEEAYRVLHWKGELWIAEIKSRFGRVGKKGRVVEHSVGNRKKQAALAKASIQQKKVHDEAVHEETLAVEVDGVESVKSESDVQDFLKALERRGFLLKDGTDSVDLSNKMFVDLQLVKNAVPSKGKGADEKKGGPHARKAQPEAHISAEDEAKTLKPCLYKVR